MNSGGTSHIVCDKELHDVPSKFCVNASNNVSPVKGQGFAKKSMPDKRGVADMLILTNFLYAPHQSRYTLSVSSRSQNSAIVVFHAT